MENKQQSPAVFETVGLSLFQEVFMETINPKTATNTTFPLTVKADRPDLVKKIGKTTYLVKIHFSETSRETMSDKIKRMLRNEASQM